jgi:uncharacterized membrane protein
MEQDSNKTEVPSVSKVADDSYESQDGLSPLAIGYAWVVRITTFCFEFAALLLLGRFVDVRLGVSPWGLIVGFVIGLFAFITGLIATIKSLEEAEERDERNRVDKRS